jgi:hypothetical protein
MQHGQFGPHHILVVDFAHFCAQGADVIDMRLSSRIERVTMTDAKMTTGRRATHAAVARVRLVSAVILGPWIILLIL